MNARQIVAIVSDNVDLAATQLWLEQLQRVIKHAVNIESRKLGGAPGARKIQKFVDYLAGAVSLAADFFEQRVLGIVFRQHAQQHLRVRRNTSQRRIDLVGYAGRQQTDRRQFLALLQLLFQLQSLSNVLKNHQRAGLFARVSAERRQRNVEHQRTACARGRVQFVNLPRLRQLPTIRTQNLLQGVGKVFHEQVFDFFADGFVATEREDLFERRVQARDASVQIDREQADIDRLDNRFIEFLKQLEFSGVLLLLLIKQTVFDGYSDIARYGAENLDVFGGEQRAVGRAAESDDRHHAPAHHARHVIMQHPADEAVAFRR